ncbi:uncharacterized protein MONBRDRAFT_32484 [Monosiga brevicollis MX1]|uniref:calcium/calmodulin-dependent protein kinase n=1 Tax=Monosiga brevicollis TaxID=81824 RepID=A9UZT1_MONBE|nr:uncharacterized protein MONBRDRAFT_32484 [Monosiga brevicollis MX1]EDQ89287.1 predicted protein [Monosiga brevicollis MX1]|eukprot:XP_001745863.1 hypothetical protein [Monosiga brevicollis MX1]
MAQFTDVYDCDFNDKGTVLGKGAFSIVHRCVNKATGEVCAVKVINTAKVKSSDIAKIEREIAICTMLKHDHIVRLRNHYKDRTHYYLVFEYVSGGELFDEIVTRSFYNEKDARDCMYQILVGLQHCHERNIIHRDLKPENLLLASREKDAPVKITDFGLAVLMENGPSYFGFAGTPGYLSPEVIKRQAYDTQVDVFACGTILYILLCGYPPFWDDNQQALYEQIKRGSYDYPSPEWDTVTPEAKDLIDRMLTTNPTRRITVAEALKHPWLADASVPSTVHRQTTIDELQRFNARRKLKGSVKAVMGVGRMLSLTAAASMFMRKGNRGASEPGVVQQETITSTDTAAEKDTLALLTANQRLFKAILFRDWSTYKFVSPTTPDCSQSRFSYLTTCTTLFRELVDEDVTCFEPEAKGYLIEGLNFHKFYFENLPRRDSSQVNTTIIDPKVKLMGDSAITTYVRLTQSIDKDGAPRTQRSEETRVWTRAADSPHGWKNVHFHRSGDASA